MARWVAPGKFLCPGPCGEVKSEGEFYSRPSRSYPGARTPSHYCKPCHREKQRANRARGRAYR